MNMADEYFDVQTKLHILILQLLKLLNLHNIGGHHD